MIEYDITGCPKPRQTQSDRWKKRPCVMRYRAYADEVRLRGVKLPESGAHITFVLPMPKSWSKRKKAKMDGVPHQNLGDVDNFCKALMDAVYKDDSAVWDVRITKLWGHTGKIIIKAIDTFAQTD